MYSSPIAAFQQIFEPFTCPLCLSEYNHSRHYPMQVCPSLHLTCRECTQTVLFPNSAKSSSCPECQAIIERDQTRQFRYAAVYEKMAGIEEAECYARKMEVLNIYIEEQEEKIKGMETQRMDRCKEMEKLGLENRQMKEEIGRLKTLINDLSQKIAISENNKPCNPEQRAIISYISEQLQVEHPQQLDQPQIQPINQPQSQISANNNNDQSQQQQQIQQILSASKKTTWQQLQLEQALNLEGFGLGTVPGSVWGLRNLKALSLRNCGLSGITGGIGEMVNLVYLEIDTNRIKQLPDSLCELAELMFLHLYNNQLTALPDNFGKLTNLTQLFASQNNLTHLPPTFPALKNLTILSLQSNPLSSLPPTFSSLKYLQYLQLSLVPQSHLLTTLPVLSMKNLRKLVLWYCERIDQEENQKLLEDCLERGVQVEIGEEMDRVR